MFQFRVDLLVRTGYFYAHVHPISSFSYFSGQIRDIQREMAKASQTCLFAKCADSTSPFFYEGPSPEL